jgi:o-succinylbenzoate synthase
MVRIDNVAWLPYRLPYRSPFATAHGREEARAGALLRLEAGGRAGLGDAAPVTAFGGGTQADALALLAEIAPRLRGMPLGAADALLGPLLGRPGGAAVACALDTALCDLRAQARGLPLAQWLAADRRPTTDDRRLKTNDQRRSWNVGAKRARTPRPSTALPLYRSVLVNATVGAAETEAACAQARAAAERGFGCVKLKVGLCATPEAEVARIAAVRAAVGPGVRLRLDANGAWDAPGAVAILRAAAALDLELVEQPVAPEDLAGMALVRAAAGVPVAADEAVCAPEQARRVLEAGAADLLVVKPMLAGGLRPARAVALMARRAGCRAIVTTTIDSGVGNTAALHLAATLPPDTPACGLATAALLAGDLTLDAPAPSRGRMAVPRRPGLGVTLDPDQIARYADGWRSR